MKKAAFFGNSSVNLDRVYAFGRKEQVASLVDLYEHVITEENLNDHIDALSDLQYIFTTWGMFVPTEEQLDRMPKLEAVFYAAGSVKGFAEPFLKRGIRVISAANANAEFVADFAASQIQLGAKGFFHNFRCGGYNSLATRNSRDIEGMFEIHIGLIGAGFVGRKVISRLRDLPSIHLMVYDPFLTEEGATALGVKKASLEELFSRCLIVSNHAPNIPETVKMLRYEHFSAMMKNSTFINTGRGATVDEDDLTRALSERPDIVALLDVTWPEPPLEDSLLLNLPNIFYTTHIAGALGNEVCYMADLVIEDLKKIEAGEEPVYAVSLEALARMA